MTTISVVHLFCQTMAKFDLEVTIGGLWENHFTHQTSHLLSIHLFFSARLWFYL
jgi:hypothetical protein